MTQGPARTPEQHEAAALIRRAEKSMMSRVHQVVEDVARQVAADFAAIAFEDSAPHRDYFVAVAHRAFLLRLCGADAETGKGGDPRLAAAMLKRDRDYVTRHWGAVYDETRQMVGTCAQPDTPERGGQP